MFHNVKKRRLVSAGLLVGALALAGGVGEVAVAGPASATALASPSFSTKNVSLTTLSSISSNLTITAPAPEPAFCSGLDTYPPEINGVPTAGLNLIQYYVLWYTACAPYLGS